MSIVNGIIQSPVEIKDLASATGSTAGGDLWRLVFCDRTGQAVAWNESTGWAMQDGNPNINPFAESGQSEWAMNTAEGRYMPRLRRASYLPSNIVTAASLEMFEGYKHASPRMSLTVPATGETASMEAEISVAYKMPYTLFGWLFDWLIDSGRAMERVYLVFTADNTVKHTVRYYDGFPINSATSLCETSFRMMHSGINPYEGEVTRKVVTVEVCEYSGSGSLYAYSNYTPICKVGWRTDQADGITVFTGLRYEAIRVDFTVEDPGEYISYTSVYYTRDNDNTVLFMIDDLVVGDVGVSIILEARNPAAGYSQAIYLLDIPAGATGNPYVAEIPWSKTDEEAATEFVAMVMPA